MIKFIHFWEGKTHCFMQFVWSSLFKNIQLLAFSSDLSIAALTNFPHPIKSVNPILLSIIPSKLFLIPITIILLSPSLNVLHM